MAIKDTTKPTFQLARATPFKKPSLLENSPIQHEEFLSLKKAARVSLLKSRFADLICKAQQTLQTRGKASTGDHDQVIIPWREDNFEETREKLKIKKRQEVGAQRTENDRPHHHHHSQLAIRRRQEVLERRREADHDQLLRIKKRPKVDVQREACQDDPRSFKKKRSCDQEIERQRKDDRKLKRRQEIEIQREAARIAINKITKTVDFDNLSVMAEFERLLCCS